MKISLKLWIDVKTSQERYMQRIIATLANTFKRNYCFSSSLLGEASEENYNVYNGNRQIAH